MLLFSHVSQFKINYNTIEFHLFNACDNECKIKISNAMRVKGDKNYILSLWLKQIFTL